MARKKTYSNNSQADGKQDFLGLCPSCGVSVKIVRTLLVGIKKRWEWRCKSCGCAAEPEKR